MSVIYLNWKKKSVLILDLMIYDTESRSRQTYFSSIVSNHKTFLSSFITHHTPGTSSLLALLPTCLRRDRPFSLFYSFYLSIGGDCVICLCLTPPLRDELYYKLCKQSVDMCCCLATVGGESNRISVRLHGCVLCVCVCVCARACLHACVT